MCHGHGKNPGMWGSHELYMDDRGGSAHKGMLFHKNIPVKGIIFQNSVPSKGITFSIPFKGMLLQKTVPVKDMALEKSVPINSNVFFIYTH